jgi:hypothetical protein
MRIISSEAKEGLTNHALFGGIIGAYHGRASSV